MTLLLSTATEDQLWNREQLARVVRDPRWRIGICQQPGVVLGCSQRAVHDRLHSEGKRNEIEVVLRESGGGAVLVGPWMLSLSLALPRDHAWSVQGSLHSYRQLGRLFAETLRAGGVGAHALCPEKMNDAQIALRDRGLPPLAWACFGDLSPWEVVNAEGRKLVGLAQRRRSTGTLLVAGLLVERPPWSMLCALLDHPDRLADILRQRTTDCARELRNTPTPLSVWVQMLHAALTDALTRNPCVASTEA